MEEQNNLLEKPETPLEEEKKYVFINTENINYTFEKIVDELNLNSNDTIIFMQSKNSKRININSIKNLISCGAKIEFEMVEIDINNSMDIQAAISLAKIAIDLKSKYKEKEYGYYIHGNKINIESLFKYITNKFI